MTLFSLEGRIALVTGGSRGIGRMIAKGLLCQGAKVYIVARTSNVCDATAKELSAFGPCISIPCDISTKEGITQLVRQLSEKEKHLDILINNAGTVWGAPFDEFPESGWDRVVDLNMKTPFFLTQALAPMLRQASTRNMAKVVNIASVDGISVCPYEDYSYAASKAGIIHLTKRMSLQLINDKICVNAIAPGAFISEMNAEIRDNSASVALRIPAKRIGREEDIASAAIYLSSSASDYVVGHTLIVDGGITLTRN